MQIRSISPTPRINQVSFGNSKVLETKVATAVNDAAKSTPAVKVYGSIAESLAKITPKFVKEFIKNGVSPSYSQAAALGNKLQAWSGIWIGGLYVINTQINKNIPEERKPALHINNVFTSVFAFVSSSLLMGNVNKAADAFGKKYLSDERVAQIGKKINLDGCNGEFFRKGVKFAAQTALITGIFRFVGPVIAGPIAQQIVKFSVNKGWIKDPKAAKASHPESIKSKNINPSDKSVNVQVKMTDIANKPALVNIEKK